MPRRIEPELQRLAPMKRKRVQMLDEEEDLADLAILDQLDLTSQEREYLNKLPIREQRALIEEHLRLEQLSSQNSGTPLRYQILSLKADDRVKLRALELLQHYQDDSDNSATSRTALEQICRIPWGTYHQLDGRVEQAQFLDQAYQTMNRVIYGQDQAKLEIIEFISNNLNNPTNTRVIGLCGPPGTGKTSLIKQGLSPTLSNRPVFYVSLGGAMDGTFLTGSQPVWKGSSCGRLVKALIETKCMNPIIYFDELDKVSQTEKGNEIYDFLIHLSDPVQNSHIYDKFLGLELDFSKCLFVFSYNEPSLINPILLDRIRQIELSGFTTEDLFFIARDYVLPKVAKQLDIGKFTITDSAIAAINAKAHQSDGVRSLIEVYYNLFSRIQVTQSLQRSKSELRRFYPVKLGAPPLKITSELVDRLL